jgi:hypothetical protein
VDLHFCFFGFFLEDSVHPDNMIVTDHLFVPDTKMKSKQMKLNPAFLICLKFQWRNEKPGAV